MRECNHNLSQATEHPRFSSERSSHLINLAKYYGKNNIRLGHTRTTIRIYICM